ncbi:MAG: hypothetical protein INF41_00770 [Rhodospirillaceae bacterium]|nr:hypothetical protein [Rhodospirillaceae bacterium]
MHTQLTLKVTAFGNRDQGCPRQNDRGSIHGGALALFAPERFDAIDPSRATKSLYIISRPRIHVPDNGHIRGGSPPFIGHGFVGKNSCMGWCDDGHGQYQKKLA